MKLKKNLLSKGTINKIVKKDRLEIMQKELNAINGTKIFIIDVKTIEELFSTFALIFGGTLLVILIGIMNHSSPKSMFLLIFGVTITTYVQYKKPIDNYKESFINDVELPATLDTIISGLDSGMTLISIFNYIKRTKKGNTAKLITECVAEVNSGADFNKALLSVADKSFNHYFLRMAQIIKKADLSTVGLSDQLKELQTDIEEERINNKNERIGKLDNALFFPILLGYFIPLVLMIIAPIVAQIQQFQM